MNKNSITKNIFATYFIQKFLFKHSNTKFLIKKVTIIQNIWRIKKGRFSSNKSIPLTKAVKDLVLKNDREGLKSIAYALFNEKDHIRNYIAASFLNIYSSNAHLLMKMFVDQQTYISDLGVVLLKTNDEYQKFQSSCYDTYAKELNEKEYLKQINSTKRVPWSEHVEDVNPESIIEISHGGGYRYISDFLCRKNQGYKLQNGGAGLQVSTVKMYRDAYYALKSWQHFDIPARFTAKIIAKYLDEAPNAYEAGLRPEYVKYLSDIRVEKLDLSSTTIYGGIPSYINWDEISATYSPAQARRFKVLEENLKKKHGFPIKRSFFTRIRHFVAKIFGTISSGLLFKK